ncbi:DegT/DnrJ/EryC1/StrS aminotransferase family protein [Synechococcus sp. PROS-7-1]|uniref:DegT/DnrJ/EryC1/StrS family aminotransferase n=1 Tax=Synechococcus sp. PROS-7-1 TaxID=1442556 RepID=UPI0016462E0C|nr:DegT/DnrJ/EryC1/StrS family aminotransferase [Synechococcus sp. PROS-7-1]
MKIPFFDYKKYCKELPYADLVSETLSSGYLIGGPAISKFEEEIVNYTGIKHCITVGNATDAMEIIFDFLDLPKGSEVIVPAHTMIATASAAVSAGLKVKPIDVNFRYGLLTSKELSNVNLSNVSACMITQLNGICSDMDEIMNLLRSNSVPLVEDSAQGIGSFYKGTHAGGFGVGGCLSFYPAKVLGCLGDGGAIITNNDDLASYAYSVRDHGRGVDLQPLYWGRNSRLDSLNANILLTRLLNIDYYIEKRRRLASLYDNNLSALQDQGVLKLPAKHSVASDNPSTYQNYEVLAEKSSDLMAFLKDKGIGTIRQWGGFSIAHLRNLGFNIDNYPRTLDQFDRMFLLPMNHMLEEEEIIYITQSITEFYGA